MSKKSKDTAKHQEDALAADMHGGEQHPVVESGGDIDVWMIGAVGVGSTFFIVALVFFVQALDHRMTQGMQADKGWSTVDVSAYKNDQATRLAGYRWVDKATQSVAIPLEDAKRLTAQKGLREWPAENGDKPTEKEEPVIEEGAGGEGGGGADEAGAGGAAPEDAPVEEPVAPDEQPKAPEAPKAPEGAPKAPKAPKGPPEGKGPPPGKGPGGPPPKAPAPPPPPADIY